VREKGGARAKAEWSSPQKKTRDGGVLKIGDIPSEDELVGTIYDTKEDDDDPPSPPENEIKKRSSFHNSDSQNTPTSHPFTLVTPLSNETNPSVPNQINAQTHDFLAQLLQSYSVSQPLQLTTKQETSSVNKAKRTIGEVEGQVEVVTKPKQPKNKKTTTKTRVTRKQKPQKKNK
jgi:hypothetical protein